ncbi:hypothetical protein FGIG_09648 [Fasciola gigantica]|uniref:Uncharacterized protein n=1 Tax=Fasciola gigantica TaxID=46835 RepID=A0A504YZ31_FASGI|nr:hypothetical protein FGIG_09648 [Fasciola gigantica]
MSKSTALSELIEDVINFPTWLENSLSTIINTKEWSSYTFELNQMIGETLQKANIQKMDHLHSEALDEILLNESKRLTGRSPSRLRHETEQATQSIATLVKKLLKLNISILFPPIITVRKLYISLLRTDVEKTRSIRDEAILHQCQDYIEQDNSAYPMRGSVGCLYALKTMLSFFHLISNTTENLSSHIFRIAGTLVLSMNDYLPRSQPPNLEEVLTLVELLFTLMSQLPPYVTKQPPTWFRRYCPSVAHAVAEIHVSRGEPQSHAKFGFCVLQQLRRLDEQVASKILNMLSVDQGMDRPLDPELSGEVQTCC